MAAIKFWNFMGAVGLTYFCFYNFDKYIEWCGRHKREWDLKNEQRKRATQHASELMKQNPAS